VSQTVGLRFEVVGRSLDELRQKAEAQIRAFTDEPPFTFRMQVSNGLMAMGEGEPMAVLWKAEVEVEWRGQRTDVGPGWTEIR